MSWLKQRLTAQGRERRRVFAGWQLALLVLQVPLSAAEHGITQAMRRGVGFEQTWAVAAIFVLLGIMLGYLNITSLIRRLHDFDYSGWHVVWIICLMAAASSLPRGLVAGEALRIVALIVLLAIALHPGSLGENRFGPGRRQLADAT